MIAVGEFTVANRRRKRGGEGLMVLVVVLVVLLFIPLLEWREEWG